MDKQRHLNAICPYFTMFPLNFPLDVLDEYSASLDDGSIVFDPFCGRGTTNFAARLRGFNSVGVDSSSVAVDIARSKIVNVTAKEIVKIAKRILKKNEDVITPTGEFWERAYAPNTLVDICRIRESLLTSCTTPARIALKALMLGALHGPQGINSISYLSNQAPRTYAPKPNYSVRYWKRNNLIAEEVDVLQVIEKRANRYYGTPLPIGYGVIIKGNSCCPTSYRTVGKWNKNNDKKISLIITSPPYYGLTTYIQDQWIRNWFSGGPENIEYSNANQICHSNITLFTEQLRCAWIESALLAENGSILVIRFGAINGRLVSPEHVIRESLFGTEWVINDIRSAGVPPKGRRQMDSFAGNKEKPNAIEEIDVYAVLRK